MCVIGLVYVTVCQSVHIYIFVCLFDLVMLFLSMLNSNEMNLFLCSIATAVPHHGTGEKANKQTNIPAKHKIIPYEIP